MTAFALGAWPLLKAILLLVLGWMLGGWLRVPLARVLEGRLDPTLRVVAVGAIQPLMVLLALPPALDAVGVSMSSTIAVLSTAGLAIALALRDSLSNVASGAILLTLRPFRVGDSVTISGQTGVVRRIGFILTEIDTDDGRRVSITNDKVLATPIERHAVDGLTRVEVTVRVPADLVDGALLERMRDAAIAVGGETAQVLPIEGEAERVRIVVRATTPVADVVRMRAALLTRMLAETRVPPPRPPGVG